ncbi:MAG: S-adenosylmethionine:tRNA ribosyltransferase-isomerase [Egibacteraceae bacterium]
MTGVTEGRTAYDFVLPDDRIAQEPPEARGGERHDARLLVLDRGRNVVEHRTFKELGSFLRPKDVLVLNNARVVPSLLQGKDIGGRDVVVKIFSPMGDGTWHCLASPDEACGTGATFLFGGGDVTGKLLHEERPYVWRIALKPQGIDALCKVAHYIYPPYLKQAPADPEYFQNSYASRPGATALPSAGRKFTSSMIGQIKQLGVGVVELTLDIALRPAVEGLGKNGARAVEADAWPPIHYERYDVPIEVADTINERRRSGGRIVVCGTSVLRTLETLTDQMGRVYPGRGWTGLIVTPGHRFRACDVFLTNLHRPKSTELRLTSALAGRERLLDIYRQEVIPRGYQFYEFGDAMLLV